MVAVVSGAGLGLANGSLNVLGPQGVVGQANQGRAGEGVYVNSATGNLVVQNRDEVVFGRGPDLGLLRTYNSQGLLNDDNGDNWRLGVYRRVYNLTGTVSTAGSTVTRVAEDGSESVYGFDAGLGKYVSHEGAGAYDTLSFDGATQIWSWTDGDNQVTERYDAANGGRIAQILDPDGNGLTFSYNAAGLVIQVDDASGETTFLDYVGNNLADLRTVTSTGQTLIRTRYAYDASNRLAQVITDLSPEDASITDGKTYVVNYTYDGTSKRIASLTQTDGNNLSFIYIQVGADWKVASYTDATGKTTNLTYTQGSNSVPASASANNAVLSTTETQTTTTTVAPYYTVSSTDTWTSITQTVYGTSNAAAVTALQTALGNPVLAAGARLTVPQTLNYDTGTSTAANNAVLSATLTTTTTVAPYYTVQSADTWTSITQAVYGTSNAGAVSALQAALGNPVLTAGTRLTVPQTLSYTPSTTVAANAAVLSTTLTTTTSYNLVTSALTTPVVGWSTASLLAGSSTTSATAPQIKFDQNGNGMAVWALGADLFYSTYTKSNDTWSAAAVLDGTLSGNPTTPHLSMSANGNALVTWVQNNDIYARRYIAGVWDGTTTIPNLENLTGAALNPVGAINDNGRAVVAFVQASGTTNNLYVNVYNGTAWQTAATAVDDIGTVNSNSIANTVVPSVAIDAQNNATVLWLQKAGKQTADSLYFSRYTASTSTWSTPNSTTLENATTAVTAESIAFDGNGNGIAIWLQGGTLFAKSYTQSTNAWSASMTLGTAASAANLSMSANGNGLVTWVNSNNVLARRYAAGAWTGAAAETIENAAGAASSPVGAINDAGQATVTFVQATGATNDVYANRFTGGAWQTAATLIESNSNSVASTMTPRVAIDAQGNANAVWLQKNGAQTTDSVYSNRYNTDATPYYTIPSGASWSAIASAVYGSTAPASQLQSALGNPPLTAAWSSIAQTVYGDSAAGGPLQTALGNPTLTVGLRLTVPSSLTYSPVSAPANSAALSTTDIQTTNYSLNAAALTNPGAGWVGPTLPLESSTGPASNPLIQFDQNGNGIAVWIQQLPGDKIHLYARRYDKASNTWGPVVALDDPTLAAAPAQARLYVDASGNAIVTWAQAPVITLSAPVNNIYARRYGAATNTWGTTELLETGTLNGQTPVASINASGQAVVVWAQSDGTRDNIWANRYTGTAWSEAVTIETNNNAASTPSVALDAAGNISVVWTQSDGTASSIYLNRYDSSTNTWLGPTLPLESSAVAASSPSIQFDGNGNGFAAWLQGVHLNVRRFDKASNTWEPPVVLDNTVSNFNSVDGFNLYVDASGNAIVAWADTDSLIGLHTAYASRYSAATGAWVGTAEVLDTGIPRLEIPVAAINASGQAIVVSGQSLDGTIYHVVAHRYAGSAWSGAINIDNISNNIFTTTPSVALDAAGNASVVWQQSDGVSQSIYLNRFNDTAASYTVQAGDTWASIGQLLYGSSAVASALQQALGNPALTAGAQLTGFPATLSVTSTVTVPPYYTVQASDTWTTITQAVYGTSEANAVQALSDALGNPVLTVAARLTMPSSIRYATAATTGSTTAIANNAVLSTTVTTTTAVAPYYTVGSTDTWTSITQTVYGTTNASAVSALQAALGNPVLSTGLRLTVPQTLSYAVSTTASANNAVLSTTITTTTTTTVAPYYGIQAGDTWASIAQTVYGDAQAGSALQTAMGNPALTAGLHLTVPQTLGYSKSVPITVSTDITDPLGLVTSLFYDVSGQIIRILTPAVGGTRLETRYAYDSSGNVTQATDAMGNVVTYGYDANGDRILERDVAGNTITRAYDAKNELLAETSYLVPDPDGAGAGQPASPLTTRYVYNAANHLRFVVSAEGRVTEYRYNGFGQQTTAIRYIGNLYTLTGLNPGDALTEAQLTTWVGTADKTKSTRSDTTYDFRGQVASVTTYPSVDASGNGVADGTPMPPGAPRSPNMTMPTGRRCSRLPMDW